MVENDMKKNGALVSLTKFVVSWAAATLKTTMADKIASPIKTSLLPILKYVKLYIHILYIFKSFQEKTKNLDIVGIGKSIFPHEIKIKGRTQMCLNACLD